MNATQFAQADLDWATTRFEFIPANQADIREFDESSDGMRYREITGITMWENLGASSLPAIAEDAEALR